MPITPLPQFEADLAEHLEEQAEREAYEKLNAPKTIVVRYGYLKMVGEYPWDSTVKPGCGSKIVIETARGREIGEMLTSTCPNSGCSKSVSRQDMLEYIKNSGGKNYPFSTSGRALRVATPDDVNEQARLDATKPAWIREARELVKGLGLPMKVIEAEPLLGGDRVVLYYASEDRVDFRALLQALRENHNEKIELRQVGARDEARLTADYERCGQYCCCKNFLKVLKPISMRSAKVQKATLDPLKISGRCGRLMCCLRYEDETYEDLRKKLPHRKTHVGTPEGNGIVVDSQILTQLVLVELDATRKRVAIPVEDLTEPGEAPAPVATPTAAPKRRRDEDTEPSTEGEPKKKRRRRKKSGGSAEASGGEGSPSSPGTEAGGAGGPSTKKRRRRRKKPGGSGNAAGPANTGGAAAGDAGGAAPAERSGNESSSENQSGSSSQAPAPGGKKKRRRRRKKPGSGGGSGGGTGDGSGGNEGGGPSASGPTGSD